MNHGALPRPRTAPEDAVPGPCAVQTGPGASPALLHHPGRTARRMPGPVQMVLDPPPDGDIDPGPCNTLDMNH